MKYYLTVKKCSLNNGSGMTKTKPDKSNQTSTGWNNGLCQDYNKKLHKWFASRIDALWVIRNIFNKERSHNEIQS